MKTTFRKSFVRDLKNIKDAELLKRIRDVIELVEAAEHLDHVGNLKKMAGTSSYYRIRVGDYRLGVVVEGESIEFVRCLPRKDLYRYFP